ncbi:hypothetical protein AAMO2058_000321500 [Amorphochlora amoebiformis]
MCKVECDDNGVRLSVCYQQGQRRPRSMPVGDTGHSYSWTTRRAPRWKGKGCKRLRTAPQERLICSFSAEISMD